MEKIAVVINHGREKAVELGKAIEKLLSREGFLVAGKKDEKLKAIIAIGGDGTIIEGIRLAVKKEVPLIGINAGRVGFLAAAEEDDALDKISLFLKGKEGEDFLLQKRVGFVSNLIRNGKEIEKSFVVNDTVIKGMAKIANVGLSISGTHRINVRGDGILVSTTTGSTAYNLSAGGPIAAPGVRCFSVTPICKHGLPIPTILVPEEDEIELEAIEGQDIFLSNDGSEPIPLEIGDKINIEKSSPYTMVLFSKDHFYEALEKKFHLKNHSGNH